MSYANQYTKPFNEISGVVTSFRTLWLRRPVCLSLLIRSLIEPEPEDAVELEHARGQVDLNQVNFSYSPDKPLIENLNLHVKPGQRVALVGPTGCGKNNGDQSADAFLRCKQRFH